SIQAFPVIGALRPAAWPAGADWTAPGSCICVVNSHFPDLISSAACAATVTAAARDTASKLPPAALVIASGLPTLLKRTRMAALAFQRTGKTRHHRVRRGIRGPNADAIGTPPRRSGLNGLTAGGSGIRTLVPLSKRVVSFWSGEDAALR